MADIVEERSDRQQHTQLDGTLISESSFIWLFNTCHIGSLHRFYYLLIRTLSARPHYFPEPPYSLRIREGLKSRVGSRVC